MLPSICPPECAPFCGAIMHRFDAPVHWALVASQRRSNVTLLRPPARLPAFCTGPMITHAGFADRRLEYISFGMLGSYVVSGGIVIMETCLARRGLALLMGIFSPI